MIESVTVTFECGAKTCASEPGKFCHLLTPSIAGDAGMCFLFGRVEAKDGWMQRHPDCIKQAAPGVGVTENRTSQPSP